MSTGYYREDLVPPHLRGKVWPHRSTERVDGEQVERMVQSPFPPVHQGNPYELVDAFFEFQTYQAAIARAEHPDAYCEDCSIRFASVVCNGPKSCGSARVEYPNIDRQLYHCLSCDRRFRTDRLCGPCIGDRAAGAEPGQAMRLAS